MITFLSLFYRPGEKRPFRSVARRSQHFSITAVLLVSTLLVVEGLSEEATSVPGGHVSRRESHHRCRGTLGDWCSTYLSQPSVPWQAPPNGNQSCPRNCNGVGNCQADFGLCRCPAGWTGEGCEKRELRPCTNRYRTNATIMEPTRSVSLSDEGWMASRCAGICDEEIGICFCNGTYGRVPAPRSSPPGTPPLQLGRPMVLENCAPNKDDNGKPIWGKVEPEKLYGPDGWCESKSPVHLCDCNLDGRAGQFCNHTTEQSCITQCSGHGECQAGYCKCFPGYYGHDCAQRRQNATKTAGLGWLRPELQHLMRNPAAEEDPSRAPQRLRPLIYIYDLPSMYNSRMLQYRPNRDQCFHRYFNVDNKTESSAFTYTIETALHEMLAQSPHRTLNPEEADFFYLPVYSSCFAWPIFGWADFPWFYGIGGQRVTHMSNMVLQAKRWVQKNHPWWDRKNGSDHIWLASHDEGSCWMPAEVRTSIILTHWGRKDLDHESNTAYMADDYSIPVVVPELDKRPWNHILGKHACYDPKRNLVIPALRPPIFSSSPLLGATAVKRDKLIFFRGDFRQDKSRYSRGIRQELHHLAKAQDWYGKYKIAIGNRDEFPGDYSKHLASSVFCLVLPGDGYSSRASDSILNGCLPVIIMDDVDAAFETVIDWSPFSLRIPQDEIPRLPEIVMAITDLHVREMQKALSRVWHRFAYSSLPSYKQALEETMKRNRAQHDPAEPNESLPGSQFGELGQDDAFATIMGWLYSQIQS